VFVRRPSKGADVCSVAIATGAMVRGSWRVLVPQAHHLSPRAFTLCCWAAGRPCTRASSHCHVNCHISCSRRPSASCRPKALLIGLNPGRRRHRQVATRTRTVDSMLQAATLSVSLVVQRDSLPCALRCCDFAGLLLVLESGVSVIRFAFPSSAT
jgi:hypothetical protein